MTDRTPESIDREAVALKLRLRELRVEKRLAVLRRERRQVERAPVGAVEGASNEH